MTAKINSPDASVVVELGRKLTEVIRSKQLHDYSQQPGFEDLLQTLATTASSVESADRLLAIALMCKIAGLLRLFRPQISSQLKVCLSIRPTSLQALQNPDDRFYAASFWRYAQPEWRSSFLASEVVSEESAESARKEAMEGILQSTPSYEVAVTLLTTAFSHLELKTDKPANSMAKRFRRAISAFLHAVHVNPSCPAGSGFGASLRDLSRVIFSRTGKPSNRQSVFEAAEEVLGLLMAVTRLRLRSAFETNTFSILYTLRDWFDSDEWTRFVKSGVGVAIRMDATDALELAIRGGRYDKELYRLLELNSESQDSFNDEINLLIERNLGISEEMIAWLRGRTIVTHTALSDQSELVKIDTTLAELMLSTHRITIAMSEVEEELLPALETFPSLGSSTLRQLVTLTRSLVNLAGDFARERQLSLFGSRGQIVAFSALEHSFVGDASTFCKMVTLLVPGVYATSAHGRRRVVIRALVEPAGGEDGNG